MEPVAVFDIITRGLAVIGAITHVVNNKPVKEKNFAEYDDAMKLRFKFINAQTEEDQKNVAVIFRSLMDAGVDASNADKFTTDFATDFMGKKDRLTQLVEKIFPDLKSKDFYSLSLPEALESLVKAGTGDMTAFLQNYLADLGGGSQLLKIMDATFPQILSDNSNTIDFEAFWNDKAFQEEVEKVLITHLAGTRSTQSGRAAEQYNQLKEQYRNIWKDPVQREELLRQKEIKRLQDEGKDVISRPITEPLMDPLYVARERPQPRPADVPASAASPSSIREEPNKQSQAPETSATIAAEPASPSVPPEDRADYPEYPVMEALFELAVEKIASLEALMNAPVLGIEDGNRLIKLPDEISGTLSQILEHVQSCGKTTILGECPLNQKVAASSTLAPSGIDLAAVTANAASGMATG